MSDWQRDKRAQEAADAAEEARVRKGAAEEDERMRREAEAEDARLRASVLCPDDGFDHRDPADAGCRRISSPSRRPDREERGEE